MTTEPVYACPQCNQSDAVTKASILFASDAPSAYRVRPPDEPQRPPDKFSMTQNEIALTVVVGIFTAGIGWFAVPLWLLRAHRERQSNFSQTYHDWQRAMQRWSRFYYCNRDDLLFDPEQGRMVTPGGERGLPHACTRCAGPLHPDQVRWINEASVECPWCGSVVKAIYG